MIDIQRISGPEGDFSHRESISFIVPTIGRDSLQRTLDSITLRPGDELFIAKGDPPGGDWGHTERNAVLPLLRTSWLASIDDDDWYAPNARELMASAIGEMHRGRDVPIVFKMEFPDGVQLWADEDLRNGNVGLPMVVVPNIPKLLHHFGGRYEGDYDFINNSGWHRRWIHWRPEVIAYLGRTQAESQEAAKAMNFVRTRR